MGNGRRTRHIFQMPRLRYYSIIHTISPFFTPGCEPVPRATLSLTGKLKSLRDIAWRNAANHRNAGSYRMHTLNSTNLNTAKELRGHLELPLKKARMQHDPPTMHYDTVILRAV